MDLSTSYLGMVLAHPVVPSASPLSSTLDGIRRLEDAGAPAVVMQSLYEEQLRLESEQLDHYLSYFTESWAEALTWYPTKLEYHVGPDDYLNSIRQAKEAVDIPIIGSLNGVTARGWASCARGMQEAGADALELNVYYTASDPRLDGAAVEAMILGVVREVKESVSIPVAVKLSPYFSAMAHMARRLADAGADGLVLFNRFYQPDLDLDTLEVVPHLVLSTSEEMRLPLRWVGALWGRVPADLAITTGVHTHEDVLKGLMAGAKVTMMASELLENGLRRIREVTDATARWMEQHEYESVAQLQGSMSQENVENPAAFERSQYMRVLRSWRPDPAGRLFRAML